MKEKVGNTINGYMRWLMGRVCVTFPPPGVPRPMPRGVWRDVRSGVSFFRAALNYNGDIGTGRTYLYTGRHEPQEADS